MRIFLAKCLKTIVDFSFFFLITFSISVYSMCVCLFSALSRRVGALQIFIIIIIIQCMHAKCHPDITALVDWA